MENENIIPEEEVSILTLTDENGADVECIGANSAVIMCLHRWCATTMNEEAEDIEDDDGIRVEKW